MGHTTEEGIHIRHEALELVKGEKNLKGYMIEVEKGTSHRDQCGGGWVNSKKKMKKGSAEKTGIVRGEFGHKRKKETKKGFLARKKEVI